MTFHWDILDEVRRTLLDECAVLTDAGFYLAGGTALGLQIGHRDSIDFDFFRETPITDTQALFETLQRAFPARMVTKTQEERNTLGVLVDEHIRLSCMTFPYPLVSELVASEHVRLASILDIGCMKLNAITGRGAWKDYVDLYCITNTIPLQTLVEHLRVKMPTLDPMVVLKSLVYFEDLYDEPILYKIEPVSRATIEHALTERVKGVV